MPRNVEALGPEDAQALRHLLARDPATNLYLLGLLEEFGVTPPADSPSPFTFWGKFNGTELSAVIFVGGTGGLVVPSASEEREIASIADVIAPKVQLRAAVGEKCAVDAVVRQICGVPPMFSRQQRLFAVSADDLGPFTNPTLRLAVEADLEGLLPLAAGGVKETLEQDPLILDRPGFRAHVLQRIRAKRTYVYEENKRLVFKLDIGSRSQFGAELEGLYTAPVERRRGHATLSLGQISRHLLSSLPRLTLRVDDRDPSLAGVARKVGYVAGKAQRLVVNA